LACGAGSARHYQIGSERRHNRQAPHRGLMRSEGKQMRRRAWIIVAAALVALAATVTGATARTAADPGITSDSILIGGTFPLSGAASLYGAIPVAEKAYFDYVNDT